MTYVKHILILGAVLGVVVGALVFGPAASVKAAEVVINCPTRHILAYPAWSNGLKCSYDNAGPDEAKVPRPVLQDLNHTWIIVLNIIQWIIITAGYAAVVFILYGGFRYITAQGEPAAIAEAKNSILYAIVGLVVALASVMIVRTVQSAILTGKLI